MGLEAGARAVGNPPEKERSQKWNFLLPQFEEVPMKKSRFMDSQIIAVLKEAKACVQVPEMFLTYGVS
jgi:hypothetical protein